MAFKPIKLYLSILMFANSIAYLISVSNPLKHVAVDIAVIEKDIQTLLTTTESRNNVVRKHNLEVPFNRVDGESAMTTSLYLKSVLRTLF